MEKFTYWTHHSSLHELQGAIIDYPAVDHVHYANDFLPSGFVVVSWISRRKSGFTFADLPYLEVKRDYIIRHDIDYSDNMSAYLTVTFWDVFNNRLDILSVNDKEFLFTVPENTSYYKVELITVGEGYIDFHQVGIRPALEDGYLIANDQMPDDYLLTYLQVNQKSNSNKLRVIFVEPDNSAIDFPVDWVNYGAEHIFYIANRRPLGNFFQSIYDETTEKIVAQVRLALHKSGANQVEFVGFGPISSYAARFYQQFFPESQAQITDDAIDDPMDYLNERTNMYQLAMFDKLGDQQLAEVHSDEHVSVFYTGNHLDRITDVLPVVSSQPDRLSHLPAESGYTMDDFVGTALVDAAPVKKKGFFARIFGRK